MKVDSAILNQMKVFGLSPLEIKIVFTLLEKKEIQASKMQKYLPKKGPYVYRILSELENRGWIKHISQRPKIYSAVSKTTFREKLNEIINDTQNLLESQRDNFREVLKKYSVVEGAENLEKTKDGGDLYTKKLETIPERMPNFIKEWIREILQEFPSSSILKPEVNMNIKLDKGRVQFTLNSVQFAFENDHIFYGGASFCMLPEGTDPADVLEYIHKYSVDMLNMDYTMQNKGFDDEKNLRKINKFNVLTEESGSGEKCIALINVGLEGKNLEGLCKTDIISDEKTWIVTLWAESNEHFQVFEKTLKNKK